MLGGLIFRNRGLVTDVASFGIALFSYATFANRTLTEAGTSFVGPRITQLAIQHAALAYLGMPTHGWET